MPTMNAEWNYLQNRIADCILCKAKFQKIGVDCPPGHLYPSPPQPVKILFVGVAPPKKGKYFPKSTDKAVKNAVPINKHGLFRDSSFSLMGERGIVRKSA